MVLAQLVILPYYPLGGPPDVSRSPRATLRLHGRRFGALVFQEQRTRWCGVDHSIIISAEISYGDEVHVGSTLCDISKLPHPECPYICCLYIMCGYSTPPCPLFSLSLLMVRWSLPLERRWPRE